MVIDDQVRLEPIKPIHARLSPVSKLCHHFMRSDAAIVAHTDLGRINEADPTPAPKAADQKQHKGIRLPGNNSTKQL
ncbi:hypothetical protein [Nitrosomonas communis]|uniref:hypothetical protein n=1 Tax=Nitrosomonas communis TaxID=44574 RepID=UPI0026EFDF1A|nr:hypothetical protein [Nitrosomonas communis]